MKKELLEFSTNRINKFSLDTTVSNDNRRRNLSATPAKKTTLKKKYSLQKTVFHSKASKNEEISRFMKPAPATPKLKLNNKKRLKKKTTL